MRNPGLGQIVETVRKHRILTLVCSIFLVVFIALSVLPFIFNISSFKPRIERSLSSALGMNVNIGEVEGFSLMPAGISLGDLTIENRGDPVVRADRAEIDFELLPLVRGSFHIRKLNLGNPEFKIIKKKNGKYNFGRDDKEKGLPSASLRRLVMSDGIIHYSNEKSGSEMVARHCDAVIDDLIVSAKGGSHTPILLRAECSCKELEINAVKVSDLELRAEIGEKGIVIKPIKFTLFGGEGKGDINFDLKSSSPDYRVKCDLSNFRIGDVFQAFSKKSTMEGEMDFSADLSFSGRSGEAMKRTMDGEVRFRGQDLTIQGIDLDKYIESYEDIDKFNLIDLGAFFLAGPAGSLLAMEYDFAAMAAESVSGKSVIPKFISEWEVQDGVASAKDVAMTTQKNRIALKGSIDFVEKKFKDMRIAALDGAGCEKISQEISGSFRKPEISKVGPLETLVRPLTGLVKETGELLKGGRCKVFYDGSVQQPE